jgi:diguanylate cyclase
MSCDTLRMISSEIKGSVRQNDVVGRIGGEEFSVFLPGADSHEARVVAERIRASVNAAMFSPQGGAVSLPVSVVATVYSTSSSFKELFRGGRVSLCCEEQWPQSCGIL